MHEPFTGKHVGTYDELDDRRREDEPGDGRRKAYRIRVLEPKLSVRKFSIRDLLQESLTGNPFRGGGL